VRRLARGGMIDRSQPLAFSFDGRRFSGYAGDTLASALLAAGVRTVARSIKYHRPRGVFSAGAEEPNAQVALGDNARAEPNVKATEVELYQGLVARSLNCWPSVRFDLAAVANTMGRLLPAGFYYKTFMWPHFRWYEWAIRRAAGLGRAPQTIDADVYLKHYAHCDVLVVGGGPAGLSAASEAARAGARVILADAGSVFGGSLLWERQTIDNVPALTWVERTLAQLRRVPEVTLLARTTMVGYYDHNYLTALERLSDHLPGTLAHARPRQRLWHVRAREVVLASGAIERPLVFANNDRPGVMLAAAVRQYLNRYAVAAGECAVVYTNNDSAYHTAIDLVEAGVRVAAIVDVRVGGAGDIAARAAALGIPVRNGCCVVGVRGHGRVRAVRVHRRNSGSGEWIRCDLLCVSGGWNPAVHLHSQAGGSLRYDEALACFVPERPVQAQRSAGAARGCFRLGDVLADGIAAGREAAQRAGYGVAEGAPAIAVDGETEAGIEPWWWNGPLAQGKQWIDMHADVTLADIELAARENYRSVEHMKRYTTLGMATDQGKTANVTGLAILAAITGQGIGEVGTTRFRPPYVPVAFGAVAGETRGDQHTPRRLLPAHACHVAAGAVFEELGGWQRPDYYPRPGEDREAAVAREMLTLRGAAGIFDGSSLGKIEVIGPDAEEFLHRLYAMNVRGMAPGRVRYGVLLSEHGVIMDDGVVARLDGEHFLVSTTSASAARVMAWFEEWHQCEWPALRVALFDTTSCWASIAVAGPRARELLVAAGVDAELGAEAFPHMALRAAAICGVTLRVQRVSFTGELQYEMAVPAGHAETLWQRLLDVGTAFDAAAVGVEAWLRLRLEKGYAHVGVDTDGTTLPDDIGFGAAIERKREDFIGRRSLLRPAARRRDREQLVGLRSMAADVVLPIGGHVLGAHELRPPMRSQGRVTSSCLSPTLRQAVALGLVCAGRQRLGETVRVYDRGRMYSAQICARTFYDPEGKRLHG